MLDYFPSSSTFIYLSVYFPFCCTIGFFIFSSSVLRYTAQCTFFFSLSDRIFLFGSNDSCFLTAVSSPVCIFHGCVEEQNFLLQRVTNLGKTLSVKFVNIMNGLRFVSFKTLLYGV